MQTELAVSCLPLLMSIFDTMRSLFNVSQVVKNEETGEEKESRLDILGLLNTLSIEGTDPTCYRNFETVHPLPPGSYQLKENY